jgi:gliding motility-associated-like protein
LPKLTFLAQKESVSFTENKGQVHDQFHNPRKDILFYGSNGDLDYYLSNKGFCYQLSRILSWQEVKGMDKEKRRIPNETGIYRVDLKWLNWESAKILGAEILPGYTNYYSKSCPDGLHGVRSFAEVQYQNLYKGINLKWYKKNKQLKYDYILSPGADYHQIKIQIDGATKIYLNSIDELVIETPYGNIIEQSPLVIQNNRELKAKWIIENSIVGFSIENVDPKYELIIDPGVRTWGTYYGGTSPEEGQGCTTDPSGNVFLTGFTQSTSGMATVGSHQATIAGVNAFLVKFNNAGVRQWGTYYGGNSQDFGTTCATDANNNVYLCGYATSTIGIASAGSHQQTEAGFQDAFLVKFNSAGVRQWGTYYGGDKLDYGYGCAADANGNVYLCGYTSSTIGGVIATIGSHQSSFAGGNFDGFLVKFNSSGVRQWGTYYGGTGTEDAYSCVADPSGNVFLSGFSDTFNGSAISTPGAHQITNGSNGGTADAYLVKFDASGARLWGTYYGGPGHDFGRGCSTDLNGNVFLCGQASAVVGIATPGSHQQSNGGGTWDAFLVKFSPLGVRQWGTYYGSIGWDGSLYCATDVTGNVYMSGTTDCNTTSVIATSSSHQENFGGGQADAFLVKFDPNGVRDWGTYYGGSADDRGYGCAVDLNGNAYVCGFAITTNGTVIATSGSHQPNHGGGTEDAYIAQFFTCPFPASPTNLTPNGNLNICMNNTTSLLASGSGTINWYSSPGSTTVIGTGSVFITGTLSAGTYTFYAENVTCAPSQTRTPIVVNASSIIPTINVSGIPSILCTGETATLSASGAATYSWNTGGLGTAILVSPTVNATYSVIGTASNGCTNTAAFAVTVSPLPQLTISAASNSICSTQTITLNASGANSYTWFPSSTTGNSIQVSPGTTQTYTVSGEDANGCENTTEFSVHVTPTPTLNVTVLFYLCSGNATLIANGAQTYSWVPGNFTGSMVLVSPPSTTEYTVVGANGTCTNSSISTVSIGVAPPLFISSNINSGCKGTCISFSTSSNLFTPFTYYWGDTSNYTAMITTHCFSTSGVYSVLAQAFYSTGCSVVTSNTIPITIFPSPIPAIQVSANSELIMNKEIIFDNISVGADLFDWNFGDSSALQKNISFISVAHTYTAAGNYCVKLVATETVHGCKDSTTKCIDILCESEIALPNIFTPNHDEANDVFRFPNNCLKDMRCFIFDRWGTPIYDWKGPKGWWDGRNTSGDECSAGVYFYVLEYSDEKDKVIRKKGTISLLR